MRRSGKDTKNETWKDSRLGEETRLPANPHLQLYRFSRQGAPSGLKGNNIYGRSSLMKTVTPRVSPTSWELRVWRIKWRQTPVPSLLSLFAVQCVLFSVAPWWRAPGDPRAHGHSQRKGAGYKSRCKGGEQVLPYALRLPQPDTSLAAPESGFPKVALTHAPLLLSVPFHSHVAGVGVGVRGLRYRVVTSGFRAELSSIWKRGGAKEPWL